MSSELYRGITLGLWILAGASFLLEALLPGSAGAGILGPVLLAAALGWTVIGQRDTRSPSVGGPVPSRAALGFLGAALAAGIALVIVRDGDQRSFLMVAFVAITAVVLARHGRRV